MKDIFLKILADKRYNTGISYGKPRVGHKEGEVRFHIKDLDTTLERLKSLLNDEQYWKLKVLIHVHDTFKYWAKRDSAIEDPQSHASLAAKFLSEFTNDHDLVNMAQYHDENFALWKKAEHKGYFDTSRFMRNVISKIKDIDLFVVFNIIDGFTPSKEPEKLRWWVSKVNEHRPTPLAIRALALLGV